MFDDEYRSFHLFETQDECCVANNCMATTTSTGAANAGDSSITDVMLDGSLVESVAKWYFASLMEGHEGDLRCVLGTDYTSSWIAYQPSLLFDSEEACCAGTSNGAFDCEEEEEAPLSGDAHIEEVHLTIGPSSSPSSKPSPTPTHDPTGEVC